MQQQIHLNAYARNIYSPQFNELCKSSQIYFNVTQFYLHDTTINYFMMA